MPITVTIPTPSARKLLLEIERRNITDPKVSQICWDIQEALNEAAQKAPWRKVTGTSCHYSSFIQHLECGHTISQTGQVVTDAKKRRCKKCL